MAGLEDDVPSTIAVVVKGVVHHILHYGNLDAIAVQKDIMEEDMNTSISSSISTVLCLVTQTFPGHILPDGITLSDVDAFFKYLGKTTHTNRPKPSFMVLAACWGTPYTRRSRPCLRRDFSASCIAA